MRYMPFSRNQMAPGILAPGKRVYAIGDIHGRLDLFGRVIVAIEADNDRRPPAEVTIVILGDFIDRGPQSATLVSLLRACSDFGRMVILKGNHEATMIDAVRGAYDAMSVWIEFGGDATLESYGLKRSTIEDGDARTLVNEARSKIPSSDIEWLDGLPICYREDGYYFVHAGIRPGVSLRRQKLEDQLWIRDAFTSSDVMHEAIVVHGHSIDESGVVICENRIGVDTGAGRGGVLSAVGLEEDRRWIIDSTSSSADAVSELQRS